MEHSKVTRLSAGLGFGVWPRKRHFIELDRSLSIFEYFHLSISYFSIIKNRAELALLLNKIEGLKETQSDFIRMLFQTKI